MMSEKKRKRKTLSIRTKLQLLADIDKKQSPRKEIAQKYGIPHNTLSTIVKNREKIERPDLTDEFQPDRKRQRKTEKLPIDQALYQWFNQATAMSVPLSNPVITSQAELIASELGLVDFKASIGWIERFKRRHGIVFETVRREAAATCKIRRGHCLPSVLCEYREEDIFNAVETGIFYKFLPDNSLDLKGEKCIDGEKAKERMTALVAANMSGTEKLPLLVIGKFIKPGCMKNVKNLPVDYTANKKAWMTSSIFKCWLRKLDRKFLQQSRSIAMVVDNCPAHQRIDGLKSIKLIVLEPNTTGLLQPCDQGIINSFKLHYRTRVVRKYLDHIRDKMPGATAQPTSAETYRISVLDALYDMRWAWDKVTEKTIKSCFSHAGFYKEAETAEDQLTYAEDYYKLKKVMNSLACVTSLQTSTQDFVAIDSNVETTGEASVSEIVQSLSSQTELESDSDEEPQKETESKVTPREARAAIATLRHFAEQQEKGDALFGPLGVIEDKVEEINSEKLTQKTMLDFFERT